MNIFENWEKQLDKLKEIYSNICDEDSFRYKKEKPATEVELLELEKTLEIPIPRSLRDTFLNMSKSIEFRAFLPKEFSLPEELREIFSADFVISMKGIEVAEESRKLWVQNCFDNPDDDYDKVWHNKLGFMEVGNGDVIAFDLEDPKEDKRVVYLSHDDGEGHGVVLGETFSDYFSNLLLIGGCGNEDWQMLPFIDKLKGLQANCKNADTYRKLIGLQW